MSPDVAKAAVAFLQRVQLNGTEAEAYMVVMSQLKALTGTETVMNVPEDRTTQAQTFPEQEDKAEEKTEE